VSRTSFIFNIYSIYYIGVLSCKYGEIKVSQHKPYQTGFEKARERFYRDEFKPKVKSCSKCGNVLVKRDYRKADGYSPIATVRTCRFCKYLHHRKIAVTMWHGDHE
jgi:ribosomal protein L37AE/L43A